MLTQRTEYIRSVQINTNQSWCSQTHSNHYSLLSLLSPSPTPRLLSPVQLLPHTLYLILNKLTHTSYTISLNPFVIGRAPITSHMEKPADLNTKSHIQATSKQSRSERTRLILRIKPSTKCTVQSAYTSTSQQKSGPNEKRKKKSMNPDASLIKISHQFKSKIQFSILVFFKTDLQFPKVRLNVYHS
jgi:hypothetical protein